MAERCAVVGVGQTHHTKVRDDVSLAGLLREASVRALEDAELGWSDIDAVVIGTAPDSFEGVMMPELYLADALGAAGKPIMRVHTAGSVGGSTAVVASHLIQSGVRERVLTVAFEKQSESDAMWALSRPLPFAPPTLAGAGGYFAPLIRSYIRRSGAPDHMARAAIYQQLNQQAAVDGLSGHLPAAQLDGDGHGGVRLHSEQEQAWSGSCCGGSHALATSNGHR